MQVVFPFNRRRMCCVYTPSKRREAALAYSAVTVSVFFVVVARLLATIASMRKHREHSGHGRLCNGMELCISNVLYIYQLRGTKTHNDNEDDEKKNENKTTAVLVIAGRRLCRTSAVIALRVCRTPTIANRISQTARLDGPAQARVQF